MLPIRSSFPSPHRHEIEFLERDSCELAIGVGIGVGCSAVLVVLSVVRSAKDVAAQKDTLLNSIDLKQNSPSQPVNIDRLI